MKLSPSTILNIGSIACLVAFVVLYAGLRRDSAGALYAGLAIMVAAMLTPYVPYLLNRKPKE